MALRYTGVRPPGAGKFAISIDNAQEGAWLLVISLLYPRQALSNINYVRSGLRELAMPVQKPQSHGAISRHS